MVISAMFRLPEAENVVVGIRDLLELNRMVVKEIILMMKDPAVDAFPDKNAYMFE